MSERGKQAIAIRAARAEEAQAVRELVLAAYEHYVARIGLRPAPMDADYDALIRAGEVWVADVGRQLHGVLVLAFEADHVLVENVAVARPAQGTGVGSRLLEFADECARERGLGQVRLFTHELMTENRAFYPRRGFVETERRRENGFARVFFTKTLTP
jgi:GNAT superfamily N-acetyltransferase